MEKLDKPVANPTIVLREEFDDWSLIFNPDTGDIFTLNPISVFIWKRLDGKHTQEDILKELRRDCDGVPENALICIDNFIQDLLKRGLAGYELKEA